MMANIELKCNSSKLGNRHSTPANCKWEATTRPRTKNKEDHLREREERGGEVRWAGWWSDVSGLVGRGADVNVKGVDGGVMCCEDSLDGDDTIRVKSKRSMCFHSQSSEPAPLLTCKQAPR